MNWDVIVACIIVVIGVAVAVGEIVAGFNARDGVMEGRDDLQPVGQPEPPPVLRDVHHPLVMIANEDPRRWPARQDTTPPPRPTQRPPARRPASEAYDAGAWLEETTSIAPETDDPFGDNAIRDWYLRSGDPTPDALRLMAEVQRGRHRRINGEGLL